MKASETSSVTGRKYGIQRVCKAWGIARSTLYHNRCKQRSELPRAKPGPKPIIADDELLSDIREVIDESPFAGEGYRKIYARLKRKGCVRFSQGRVLRLMKENSLLSPYRVEVNKAKAHDGRITTDVPNEMWATDATKILTCEDGWVWFFGVVEHWNAQCMGWHLSKNGDRFAALEALANGLRSEYGSIDRQVATGLKLRMDHGSQFKSESFRKQAQYWGITPSFGYVREPETNGVIERFHRTLKEQVIHGRTYRTVEDVRAAVDEFIKLYNKEWLIGKLGYQSPIEARTAWKNRDAA